MDLPSCEMYEFTYIKPVERGECMALLTARLLLLQAAPSVTNPAQHPPAQGPLASGSDGDAFAASILVEPGVEDTQQPPAQHSPSQRPADAAQSDQPAAVPSPEPMDAASDEPVAGRGPEGQSPVVPLDGAAVPPCSASEPSLPGRSPVEPAAEHRELPPLEPDVVEPDARLDQAEAVTAEASYPSPTTAAEADYSPGNGSEQPLGSQSAPAPHPDSHLAAHGAPVSGADASVAVQPDMPNSQVERLSDEPAMLAQYEPPPGPSLPEVQAAVEPVPADDHGARPDADAVVSVGVGVGSTTKADDDRTGDAAAGGVSAAHRADENASLQEPDSAAHAELLPAEGTWPAGVDPAVGGHGALPASAGAPEGAEQGGGIVPADPAPMDDRVLIATAEAASGPDPDSQYPAAAGRVCLHYTVRTYFPV